MTTPGLSITPPSRQLDTASTVYDVRLAVAETLVAHAGDESASRQALRNALDAVSRQQLIDTLVDVANHNLNLCEELSRQRETLGEAQPAHETLAKLSGRLAESGSSNYMPLGEGLPVLKVPPSSTNLMDFRAPPRPPQRARSNMSHLSDSITSVAMARSATHPESVLQSSLRRFSNDGGRRPSRSVRIVDDPVVHLTPTTPLMLRSGWSFLNESNVTLNTSAAVVKRGDIFDSVNDLDFVRPIGSGTQATVWLCVDVTSGEERAVKVIDRSHCADTNDARLAEIEVAMRLQHDNVIRLYEVIDDPSAQAVFLVMEYVEDGASGSVDAENGECDTSLSPQQLLDVARGAAEGLQYCHARGVVHGDLKPENLLVDLEDDTVRAVLADFGVAKVCDADDESPLMPPRTMRLDHRIVHDQDEGETSTTSAVEAVLASSVDPRLPSDLFDVVPTSRRERRTVRRYSASVISNDEPSSRLFADAPCRPSADMSASLLSPTNVLSGDAPPMPSRRRFSVMFVPEEQSIACTANVEREAVVGPIQMPSLRDVGGILIDKTRALSKCHSEVLRANFAKRGPKTQGGTPAFQAPELLEGGQPTPASDMWALGVTLYALVFKRLPWHGATWFELKTAVCETSVLFPVETVCDREQRRWRGIIERLLHKDPMERMTAVELGNSLSFTASTNR